MNKEAQPYTVYACAVRITDELLYRIRHPDEPYKFCLMAMRYEDQDEMQKIIEKLLVPQGTTTYIAKTWSMDFSLAAITFYFFCQGVRPSQYFYEKPEGAEVVRVQLGISEGDGSLYVVQ